MNDLPLLHPATLNELREIGGQSFLTELIQIYLDDIPLRFTELRQALANNQREPFIRAAHTIKGSSSNLGATQLQHLAGELESTAKTAPLPSLVSEIDALEHSFTQTATALRTLPPPLLETSP